MDQTLDIVRHLLPFAMDGVGLVENVGDPLLLRQRRQRDFGVSDNALTDVWLTDAYPLTQPIRNLCPQCVEEERAVGSTAVRNNVTNGLVRGRLNAKNADASDGRPIESNEERILREKFGG